MDALIARVGGELAFGIGGLTFYLFRLIDSLTENLFQSLLFGSICRLHMLGVFQHLLRQAGLLAIAFQFSHGLAVPGNRLLAFRHLVHDARKLLQNLFTVDGHQRIP